MRSKSGGALCTYTTIWLYRWIVKGRPALSRAAWSAVVSWDCLGTACHSLPTRHPGQLLRLLSSRGSHVLVLDARRDVLAGDQLSAARATIVLRAERYAPLRRGTNVMSVLTSASPETSPGE